MTDPKKNFGIRNSPSCYFNMVYVVLLRKQHTQYVSAVGTVRLLFHLRSIVVEVHASYNEV